jgi:hypothetical protein
MLAEIDENLIRNDLTASDKAILIPRREKLILDLDARDKEVKAKEREARKGELSAPNGADKSHKSTGVGRGKGQRDRPSEAASSRDLSAKTGISKGEVHRAKARASALGEAAVQAINRTDLDKPGEMDALAKLPEPEREEVIAAAVPATSQLAFSSDWQRSRHLGSALLARIYPLPGLCSSRPLYVNTLPLSRAVLLPSRSPQPFFWEPPFLRPSEGSAEF